MDLLEKAESTEDVIYIQSQLTNVRYELESYESQLRVYDNRVNYSTLYLDINEVDRESSVATKLSYGEEIAQGLSDTFYNVGQGLRSFSIWLIVNLPILVILALIVIVVVLVIRKIHKKNAQKRAKRPAVGGIWTDKPKETRREEHSSDKEK
jgi:hypothetical protein